MERLLMLRILIVSMLGIFCWQMTEAENARVLAAGKRPETQKYCPVFTDRIVGSGSRFLRYKGIKVYFSSDLAARKWMRDPVSYLDTDLLPQLQELTFPERPIPQQYCPVFPKRKISFKDPSVIYQDKRVYLFDAEAVKTWNSAPEKFLDPDILPQFAEEEKSPDSEDEKEKEASPKKP